MYILFYLNSFNSSLPRKLVFEQIVLLKAVSSMEPKMHPFITLKYTTVHLLFTHWLTQKKWMTPQSCTFSSSWVNSKQVPSCRSSRALNSHPAQPETSASFLQDTYMDISDSKDNVQATNWNEKWNEVTHSICLECQPQVESYPHSPSSWLQWGFLTAAVWFSAAQA